VHLVGFIIRIYHEAWPGPLNVFPVCALHLLCAYNFVSIMKEKFIVNTVIAINVHLNHVLYPRKHTNSTLQNLQRKLIFFV